jgi:hypothetical protein
MRCRLAVIVALLPVALVTAGFEQYSAPAPVLVQPGDERASQDPLPQSHDPFWKKLAECQVSVDEKNERYTIDIVPEIKALDGKTITVSGFVLPLEASDEPKHFLLAKRTPVCLFCPPGSANEVIEVFSKHPVPWSEDAVNVRGQFKLVDNGDQGIFFSLLDAEQK